MSEGLLSLAIELANVQTPTEHHFRKAVSTAYYAAFHALCEMVANQIAGENDTPLYTRVYRKLDHANFDKKSSIIFNISDQTNALRDTLNDLRQKREDADYNPEKFSLSKVEIKDITDKARNAISLIKSINAEEKKILAVNILTGKDFLIGR